MSYTVKKGDTLGGIAKKLGTTVKNLTGYRSGDANKIFPGETISVQGSTPKAPEAPDTETKAPDTEVESSLSVTKLVDESKKSNDETKSNRDSLIKDLAKNRREDYEREFEDRGLDDIKGEIDDLTGKVTERRQARDTAIDKVSANPFASAGTITGRVGRVQDLENSQISNLLGEAQNKYGQYSRELGEIGRLTGYSDTADQLALGAYNTDLTNGSNMQNLYTQALLGGGSGNELQDKLTLEDYKLANELQLIRERAKYGGSNDPSLQLITDILGNPTGSFNRQTGAVNPITGLPTGSVVQTPSSLALAQSAQNNTGGGGFLSGISNWMFGN